MQSRGVRYESARLDNFELYGDEMQRAMQQQVLDAIGGYAKDMAEQIQAGNAIIAYGPPGTGKDHLLMALAHVAIEQHGFSVGFANVMDWFGDVRSTFGGNGDEADVVGRLKQPDILILSDPVPPEGDLTPFQKSTLYRVIDARYSARKSTWTTINVESPGEAEDRVGLQVIDRLADGGLSLHFNWPSNRRRPATPSAQQ